MKTTFVQELLKMMFEYIKKYYPNYLERIPFSEYEKYYCKFKYDQNNRVLTRLRKLLYEKFGFHEDLIAQLGEKYNYESNIKGVRVLMNILKLVKDNEYNDSFILDEDDKAYLYYYVELFDIIINSSYTLYFINNMEKAIEFIDNALSKKREGYIDYYRGQSDSKWNLIPSIYRDIKEKQLKMYDCSKIINIYDKKGIIEKYSKLISDEYTKYEMISFFQHAISYSPLLDFTSNIIVAIYFALSVEKGDDIEKNDSAIFMLRDNEYKQIDIVEYDEKLEELNVIMNNKRRIYFEDLNLIREKMGHISNKNATTTVFKTKHNDRMKYQDGVLVLFNDFIIHNPLTDIIVNRSSKNSIIKIIITKEIKKELINYLLKEFPEYKPEYMMNPYEIFKL